MKCDPLNTLMDIGYTYLFNFADAHLRLYGFDTYMGVYHQVFTRANRSFATIWNRFAASLIKRF